MLGSLLLLALQADRYDVAGKDYDAAMETFYSAWSKELGGAFDGQAKAEVHDNPDEYEKAGAPRHSFSHYDPKSKTAYARFDPENRDRGRANTFRYLAFEGTRQFLHLAFPKAYESPEFPAWLEEGLAEVFAAACDKDGKLAVRSPIALYTHADILCLQRMIRDKKTAKLAELLSTSREDLAARRGTLGVQAWAIVYYFMDTSRAAIPDALKALEGGAKRDDVHAKLFGDPKKLDAFQSKVFDYFKALKPEIASKDDGKFVSVETEHYTIQVDRTVADVARVSDDGSKIMELIFTKYQEAFRAEGKLSQKPIARFYADMKGYLKSGAPGGSAAYYNPATKELVGFNDPESFNIMCHEGCHQFFDLSFPGFFMQNDLPMWFCEGLADAFGASEIRGKDVYIFTVKGIAHWRLPVLKSQVLKDKKYATLRSLLTMPQPDFMKEASLHYAESWSFCHFLWNYPSVDEGNGKYRETIIKLIEGFKAGRAREDVYKDAFQLNGKPLSIDDLQAEWMAYLKRLPEK